jgi:carbon monoxide dehydrogenase subunit G
MIRKFANITIILLLAASLLPADFTYQETSTITGGAMQGMMKVAGVFSKQLREPMKATVSIQGNRMVHRGPSHASIIDLDSQTITHIDLQKKTYSVMTFEQMKQMMEDASKKMQQSSKKDNADVSWKVSASSTGNSKQSSGVDAKEMLVKMTMEGTDQKSGQKGGMDIVMHNWLAPGVPGYAEVREFYRKMGEKLNWAPGGNMFLARPDIAKGMADAAKEMSKLDGTPVLMTMAMGPTGTVNENSGQAAADAPPAKQQDKPSLGGALGGALGGKFGLGRKKEPPQQQEPAANSGGAQTGSLLEMTTEYSGFSTSTADASLFEIPAGFKKVDSDLKRVQQ